MSRPKNWDAKLTSLNAIWTLIGAMKPHRKRLDNSRSKMYQAVVDWNLKESNKACV